jgi:hypothetical protein
MYARGVRRRNLFLLAFLAIQLGLPLAYYTAPGRDTYDERFAWRMFSPTRMTQCSFDMAVGGEPVSLDRIFHEAWIGIARRGRRDVVDAMARRLCHDHPGRSVTLTMRCVGVDLIPNTLSHGGRDLCTTGGL